MKKSPYFFKNIYKKRENKRIQVHKELELENESKVDAEVLEEPAFEVEFVEALKLELANEDALTDNANIINPDINNILMNIFFLNIFPPMLKITYK